MTRHAKTLHNIALHCTTLHDTAVHCTALHSTALHCTALHDTKSCNPTLRYTTLHTTHCTSLNSVHDDMLRCADATHYKPHTTVYVATQHIRASLHHYTPRCDVAQRTARLCEVRCGAADFRRVSEGWPEP